MKLIRYTAKWCGPCKALAPAFEQLKTENPDVTFETIDIDVDTSNKHGINGVPTVIYEVDGAEKERIIGARSKGLYQDRINFYK